MEDQRAYTTFQNTMFNSDCMLFSSKPFEMIGSSLSVKDMPRFDNNRYYEERFDYRCTFDALDIDSMYRFVDEPENCTRAVRYYYELEEDRYTPQGSDEQHLFRRWLMDISPDEMGIMVIYGFRTYCFGRSLLVSEWVVLDVNESHCYLASIPPILMTRSTGYFSYSVDWNFYGKKQKWVVKRSGESEDEKPKTRTFAEVLSSSDDENENFSKLKPKELSEKKKIKKVVQKTPPSPRLPPTPPPKPLGVGMPTNPAPKRPVPQITQSQLDSLKDSPPSVESVSGTQPVKVVTATNNDNSSLKIKKTRKPKPVKALKSESDPNTSIFSRDNPVVAAKAVPTTKSSVVKRESLDRKRAGKAKPDNKRRNAKDNHQPIELDPAIQQLVKEAKMMGKKEVAKMCLSCNLGFAVLLHEQIKQYKVLRQGYCANDSRYWFEISGSRVPRVKLSWLANFKSGGKFPAVLDQLQSAAKYILLFKPFLVDINDVNHLVTKNFWFKQHQGSLYVYCLETDKRLSWTALTAQEWDDLGIDWIQSNNNFSKAVQGLLYRQEQEINRAAERDRRQFAKANAEAQASGTNEDTEEEHSVGDSTDTVSEEEVKEKRRPDVQALAASLLKKPDVKQFDEALYSDDEIEEFSSDLDLPCYMGREEYEDRRFERNTNVVQKFLGATDDKIGVMVGKPKPKPVPAKEVPKPPPVNNLLLPLDMGSRVEFPEEVQTIRRRRVTTMENVDIKKESFEDFVDARAYKHTKQEAYNDWMTEFDNVLSLYSESEASAVDDEEEDNVRLVETFEQALSMCGKQIDNSVALLTNMRNNNNAECSEVSQTCTNPDQLLVVLEEVNNECEGEIVPPAPAMGLLGHRDWRNGNINQQRLLQAISKLRKVDLDTDNWMRKIGWSLGQITKYYAIWLEFIRLTEMPINKRNMINSLDDVELKHYWLNHYIKKIVDGGYHHWERDSHYLHHCWVHVATLEPLEALLPWVPTEREFYASTHEDSIFKGEPFFIAGKLARKTYDYLFEHEARDDLNKYDRERVLKHYLVNNFGERIRVKFSKLPISRSPGEDVRPVPLKFGDVVYKHESVVAHFKTKDHRSTYNRIVDKIEFDGKGNKNKRPWKTSKLVLDFWDGVNGITKKLTGRHLLHSQPNAETSMKIEYAKLLNIMCGHAIAPSLTPESRKAIIERNITRMTQVNVDGFLNLDSTNQNLDANTIYVANFISECAIQSSEFKQKLIVQSVSGERKNALRVGPGYY